jgi:phage/plasmid-associated DNA primase
MNQIPKFDGTDGGMRRRIKRLVFPWSFGKVNEKRANYSLGVAYNIDVK